MNDDAKRDDAKRDDPKRDDAADELKQSRQRLHDAIAVLAHPPRHPLTLKGGVGNAARELLQRVRSVPAVALVGDVAGRAWERHPARRVGVAVIEAVRPPLARAAREKPGALALTAAGLGVLMWAVRPWVRSARPGPVAKLLPKVAKKTLKVVDENARQDRQDRRA